MKREAERERKTVRAGSELSERLGTAYTWIERAMDWRGFEADSWDEAYRQVVFGRRNMLPECPNRRENAAERISGYPHPRARTGAAGRNA